MLSKQIRESRGNSSRAVLLVRQCQFIVALSVTSCGCGAARDTRPASAAYRSLPTATVPRDPNPGPDAAATASAPIPPAPIVIDSPALYPETAVYDASGDRLLLGSVRTGGIYELAPNGAVTRFVSDERLCSVLGMALDVKRRRLLAVTSDLGVSTVQSAAGPKKQAALGVYDLDSGAPIHYVDLATLMPSGDHLANGIALDDAGNAYITDSFSPAIYKVDSRGQASLLVSHPAFNGSGINLNGVVVHPDGYLLVVKKSDGALFKIPLTDPSEPEPVHMDQALFGGDGLVLTNAQQLIVIANEVPGNAENAALALTSDDGWKTARVQAKLPLGDVYPTTAVVRHGELFALHSGLKELLHSTSEARKQSVRKATLQPIGTVGLAAQLVDSNVPLASEPDSPKAFVYAELQLSVPFAEAPWQRVNAGIDQQPGFVNMTWLSGVDDHSLAGLYTFSSMDGARLFATGYFPDRARELGVAQTTRLFDATATETASRAMRSVHYGATLEQIPSAFVYTEIQINAPFSSVPWRERNPAIRSNRGLLSKTWLSGVDTHTVGGLYAFDTIENAKAYALDFFAAAAARQGKAFTTRVFDARAGEQASRAGRSPFFPL